MQLILVFLAVFLISIDPTYPGSCAIRYIAASELRGIWILPS